MRFKKKLKAISTDLFNKPELRKQASNLYKELNNTKCAYKLAKFNATTFIEKNYD